MIWNIIKVATLLIRFCGMKVLTSLLFDRTWVEMGMRVEKEREREKERDVFLWTYSHHTHISIYYYRRLYREERYEGVQVAIITNHCQTLFTHQSRLVSFQNVFSHWLITSFLTSPFFQQSGFCTVKYVKTFQKTVETCQNRTWLI